MRYQVHELGGTIGMVGVSAEENIRRARLVLKSRSRAAIDALFVVFQSMQADRRWGLDNPLNEILGPLRIAAITSLHGPPGEGSKHHEVAVPILWSAAKEKDLTLLAKLLDQPRLVDHVCRAIDRALSGCGTHHPELIAKLEQVIERAPTAHDAKYPARTLGTYAIPEAERALERLNERLAPWPRATVMTALLWRSPGRHRAEAAALLAALSDEEQRLGAEVRADEFRAPADRMATHVVPYVRYELGEALREAEARSEGADDESPTRQPETAVAQTLTELTAASPARQVRLLRAVGSEVINEAYPFFRAVWPLTLSSDDEVAVAAVRACALTASDQAVQKLKTRLRRARESGDERTVRVVERGLRQAQAPGDDHDESSPDPSSRGRRGEGGSVVG